MLRKQLRNTLTSFYTHDPRMTVHIQGVSYYELVVQSVTNIFTHSKKEKKKKDCFSMFHKVPTIKQSRAISPEPVFPV